MIEQEIQKYEKMLEEDPRSRAFAPLAEAYRKAGKLEDAIRVAKTGLAIHPGYTGGLVVLGRVLYEMKELDKAREVLKRAVTETPDSYLGQKFLGKVLMDKGENKEALIALEAAYMESPDDGEVAELLELIRPKAEPPETMVFSGPEEGDGSGEPRIVTYEQKPTTIDGVELEPLTSNVDEEAFAFSEAREEKEFTTSEISGDAREPAGVKMDTVDLLGPEAAAFLEETDRIDDTAFSVPEDELDPEEAPVVVEDLIEEILEEPDQDDGHIETPLTADREGTEQPPAPEPSAPPRNEERPSPFESTDGDVPSEHEGNAPEPQMSPEPMEPVLDRSASAVEISTQTLADLYAKQGLVEKAAEIYRQILRERPSDEGVMAKLRELEEKAGSRPQTDVQVAPDAPVEDLSPTAAADEILNILENWLQNAERMKPK